MADDLKQTDSLQKQAPKDNSVPYGTSASDRADKINEQ